MIADLTKLLEDNDIKVYEKYPQSKTPVEFIILKNVGIRNDKLNIFTYDFDITICTRNNLDSFQEKVAKLLLIDSRYLNYCGNPTLETGEDVETTSKVKKRLMTFTLDKAKYI